MEWFNENAVDKSRSQVDQRRKGLQKKFLRRPAFNNKVIIKGPPGPVPGLDVNPACCPSTDPACNPSGNVTNVLSPVHFKSSCGCYDSASIVAGQSILILYLKLG